MDILAEFEYISDVVAFIELCAYEAKSMRGKEKRDKLREAQQYADAYQKHCEAGGNYTRQFVNFIP